MLSLKQIEKPKFLTKKQHKLILWFLGNLVTINEHIKENKDLFWKEWTEYKILDKQLWESIYKEKTTKRRLKCKAMAEYLIWDSLDIELLWWWMRDKNYESINDVISKYYLYPFFEDKWTISDNILYMWNDLFKNIRIQLISDDNINMYFGRKPMDMFQIWDEIPFAFEYYTNYSRDKLLEAEIKLWYINSIIWDKTRWMWYTHLLRANVWEYMTMPAKAIELILGWSKFNMYLTSRKQGKTSFWADRIVAELLSEKRWYGMRKSRRIKFFTDNASSIWNEVMQFIKDFLWDLVDQEIRPWLKYFDIKESRQEVICNLTGNTFSVVSLKWLQGNSDNSTGDWLACDCAIIDEWFRIIWRFWKSFKDRAFEECDWILFLSTLNEETEIWHWGYTELIKWEAWCNPDFNTIRSSDFDNSITYFNNFKRRWLTLKDFYKYTWNKLYEKKKETSESYIMKRMLCWILSDKVLFDITGRITASNDKQTDSDLRIVWIDMWWLEDLLWVWVFNVKQLIQEEWYSKKIDNYKESIELAAEYKNKYPNCITVWDRWWPVWEAAYLLDMKTKHIDYWIKNTSGKNWMNEKEWYYTVPKWTLVLSWSYALSNIVKVMISCQDLIKQFGDMEMKQSTRGNTILYKGKKGRKDDAVFAFLLIFWLLRIVFQLLSWEDMINFAKEYSESEVITYDDDDEDYYYSDWMTY